jgi:hypothetical protein
MIKKDEKHIALDRYEEGAVISALNDMRNEQLGEKRPTDFVDELMLKILHTPSKKVSILGPPRSSAGASRGEEEQRSEADTRRKLGVAERSLRRRDESR